MKKHPVTVEANTVAYCTRENFLPELARIQAKQKRGEGLTVPEHVMLMVGEAVDILWPPEDPEQQWEIDTIEHVADVFSTLRPESEG